MITKEQARARAEKYLSDKEITYVSIDKADQINFMRGREIVYGPKKGIIADLYIVGFEQKWGLETRLLGIYLDANSGEILFLITPHSFIDAR